MDDFLWTRGLQSLSLSPGQLSPTNALLKPLILLLSSSLASFSGPAPHLPKTCPLHPIIYSGGCTMHICHKALSHTCTHTTAWAYTHIHTHIPTCTLTDTTSTLPRYVRLGARVTNSLDWLWAIQVLASKVLLNPETPQSQANLGSWSICQNLKTYQ